MSKRKVSIVITNYNGIDLLKKHLPKVFEASRQKINNIIEVVVVDDASTDGSVDFLKDNYSEVRVIVHKKNLRFAETVNSGFREAKGELVCLLNNDVSPATNFLRSTIALFENEDVFGVSLGELDYSWSKGIFQDGFVEHASGKRTKKHHSTFWISGGSGLFRKSMWKKLSGMDSKLFSPFYWEDLDISYRAMKRGWKLLWDPSAKVTHEHESTNKAFDDVYRSRIQERNQLLFIWKNITSTRMFRQHLRGLIKRSLKHPGYLRIVLMSFVKIRWLIPARISEKKKSIISDESIFAKF
ncbi:glycosyltransferase family 2 protein [Patescibacteria group bacterium]